MRIRMLFPLIVLFFTVSCSDSRTTLSPSTHQPVTQSSDPIQQQQLTLTVLSGENGPVANATVMLGDSHYTTTNSGTVDIEHTPADTPVDIDGGENFLLRETKIHDSALFTLWPVTDGVTPNYLRELVYGEFSRGGRLNRIEANLVSIALAPNVKNNERLKETHKRAIQNVNAALKGKIVFSLGNTGPIRVEARIDANDEWIIKQNACAVAYRTFNSYSITKGKIVYRDNKCAESAHVVVHEIGHILGFNHSPNPNDIMNITRNDYSITTFSRNEQRTLHMMLKRRPGNRFPDNDQSITAMSGLRTIEIVE